MPVRVLLPNAFQKHTNGAREITSTADNLPALITEIETTFPALKTHLRDDSGQVRKFINFYVNEEDIRFLGNDKYAFKDGDEVLVIPSIAGGCCAPGDTVSAAGVRVRDHLCSCCSYCGQEPCCCGD
ncbi:MAG: MoaD/ThiS family protein [Acidobacteriaceae bacterium]|jgi:sulfur-carrier protein